MNGPAKNKGHKKDVVARKRLNLVIQSFVVIIFVSAAWLAQATQFNLQILVSDVKSRSPISLRKPFTAELEFGNETINFSFNNNIGKYVLNKDVSRKYFDPIGLFGELTLLDKPLTPATEAGVGPPKDTPTGRS